MSDLDLAAMERERKRLALAGNWHDPEIVGAVQRFFSVTVPALLAEVARLRATNENLRRNNETKRSKAKRQRAFLRRLESAHARLREENEALRALLDEASTYVIAANFAGARDDLLRRIDAALEGRHDG
jgi:hypothetical protein